MKQLLLAQWLLEHQLWSTAIAKHGPQPGYLTNLQTAENNLRAIQRYRENYEL